MYDAIVIGAGPSGMTAAICAADAHIYRAFHNKQAKVNGTGNKNILLLEKNKKIGKKIYASGNGRCNVSNAAFDLGCYYSENEFFPFQIVGAEDYKTVNRLLELLGVPVSDERGYFYPMSRQASTVVWGFTDRMKKNGIEIHTGETVCAFNRLTDGWQVTTDAGIYMAKTIVVSCGSPAAPALGGTNAGRRLLESLDVPFYPFSPVLCKLSCKEDLTTLVGVRVRAEVTVWQKAVGQKAEQNGCDAEPYIYRECGEVQFTAQGLSGIVMFNISCEAARIWHANDGDSGKSSIPVTIALCPEFSEETLYQTFDACAAENPDRTVLALLNGFVHEKLATELLARTRITKRYIKELTEEERKALAHCMKHMEFEITGTAGFADAQAAAGGADTKFIKPDTMESRTADGLYITGELLDVCGKCGGYNLTWAILTGMKAGFDIYDSD